MPIEFESIVRSSQGNRAFNGDMIPIDLMLVCIRSLVQQCHTHHCLIRIALLPHKILEVTCPIGPSCTGTEADLECSEDGRFAGSILTMDEIDIVAECDTDLAVAHEVLEVDFGDDSCLGWFTRGVDFNR